MSFLVCLVLAFALKASSGAFTIPPPPSNVPPVSLQDHYALLVAGSTSYSNYRHQSDVCHAKQLLLAYGVPRENIITFVSNDIAFDSSNPFPGLLFNSPSSNNVSGVDVYQGCVDNRTYTGENVTVSNFILALTGNATPGGGPVLTSNPHSRLFINLVDHGGPGIFCFPQDELTANVLNASITASYQAGLFGSLVLYVESCESGSLFDAILPSNSSTFPVYAATASSPYESVRAFACARLSSDTYKITTSTTITRLTTYFLHLSFLPSPPLPSPPLLSPLSQSWGCFCPGSTPPSAGDFVNGTELGTCLGDLFSVSWLATTQRNCSGGAGVGLEGIEGEPGDRGVCTQSLLSNFLDTSALTNLSTPHQYGNTGGMDALAVGEFVSSGFAPFPPTLFFTAAASSPPPPPPFSFWDSRAASRASLQWRVNQALRTLPNLPNLNTTTSTPTTSPAGDGSAASSAATAHAHALIQELHTLDMTESFHHRVAEAILYFSPHLLPSGQAVGSAHTRTHTHTPSLHTPAMLNDPQFWECYKGLLVAWRGHCLPFTDHTLLYTRILFNACGGGGNATLPLAHLCKSLNPPSLPTSLSPS